MAKVSPKSFEAVLTVTAEMAQKGRQEIEFDVKSVNRDSGLFNEIVMTGNLHWRNILSGIAPTIKVDPPAEMTPESKAVYTEKAQQMTVANQIHVAAEVLKNRARNDFINTVTKLGIYTNMQSPYLGASARTYDKLDTEAAGLYLEQVHGIDPSHFRETKINMEQLMADSKAGPIQDVMSYQSLGSVIRSKLDTIAESIGFDLNSFTVREMRYYSSTQTRGPVFDAIQSIGHSAAIHVDAIQGQLLQLDQVNDPALFYQAETEELKKQPVVGQI